LCCSACGSSAVRPRGPTERTFRTLPIGRKSVVIHFKVPRVHCESCGLIRQVKIGLADERQSYTNAFERYALELSRLMTIQDVAEHLNVGWDLIKDIVKLDLSRRFGKPKFKHLTRIAIDEISVGKGHKYLTLVLDLDSGAVVFVGKGKGADALRPFWKRIWGSHAKIKAVAMDMSPAYQQAVSKYLSEAKIVFDHFHVIKLFNEKLSDLRRFLFHQVEDEEALLPTEWVENCL
jgi:transposase